MRCRALSSPSACSSPPLPPSPPGRPVTAQAFGRRSGGASKIAPPRPPQAAPPPLHPRSSRRSPAAEPTAPIPGSRAESAEPQEPSCKPSRRGLICVPRCSTPRCPCLWQAIDSGSHLTRVCPSRSAPNVCRRAYRTWPAGEVAQTLSLSLPRRGGARMLMLVSLPRRGGARIEAGHAGACYLWLRA